MASNIEKLEAAGVIKKTPLPEPYKSVIEGLSETEVEAITSVTKRLNDATEVAAHSRDDAERPEEYLIVL